jgi:serine/threonine-protein kinase HipA
VSELIALLDGREVGRVRQQRGRLSFAYAPSWRDARGAYPLSLSMPLALTEHPHSAIEPFLWGLLPDNEFVLQRWAQQFQVSPRNAFGLISGVGEDCAGAVQFVTPERFDVLRGQNAPQVQWLTEADVASRLRALKADASAMRAPRDLGQFSLAGAQPKTALLFDGKRWGVPSGRTPTTHILKPATAEFDGHAENEHFCLSLARTAGLSTATTEVRRFEDVTAIVVTRYDRVDTQALADMEDTSRGAPVRRVHQEDMCQALGLHPSRKYQNEGGPGPSEIIALLRANVGGGAEAVKEDVESFVRALLFNWLIGGTDAHAKNYSILIGGNGIVRLAPLYDVASILPYAHIDPLKAKLAMKIGNDYRLRDIGWRQWREFAAQVRLPGNDVVAMGRSMAERLPTQVANEHARVRSSGLDHPVVDRLAEALTTRARKLTVA